MSRIFLAPLEKPFNSRTSKNFLVNLNFHFVIVAVVDTTCIEYFILVFLASSIKTFGNLWKCLSQSIIHFWLITHVFQLCLDIYMSLPLKVGVCCIYADSLFVWDSRDIRSLYFSNFSSQKYILVKV